jgi:hypothetical protein
MRPVRLGQGPRYEYTQGSEGLLEPFARALMLLRLIVAHPSTAAQVIYWVVVCLAAVALMAVLINARRLRRLHRRNRTHALRVSNTTGLRAEIEKELNGTLASLRDAQRAYLHDRDASTRERLGSLAREVTLARDRVAASSPSAASNPEGGLGIDDLEAVQELRARCKGLSAGESFSAGEIADVEALLPTVTGGAGR